MDEEECMLLCDGCGTGWHTMCLMPKLTSIPRGDWLCPRCVLYGVTIADLRVVTPQPGPLLRGKPNLCFKMRHRGAEDKKSYAHLMGTLLRTKPAMETVEKTASWAE